MAVVDDDKKPNAPAPTTTVISDSVSAQAQKTGNGAVDDVLTITGDRINTQLGTGDVAPGKRTYNPLSQLSSYNYTLSLYMVTPDALNAFNLRGRKELNLNAYAKGESGIYLIAQSTGKPTNTSSTSEFDLDLYIDNLRFTTPIGTTENRAPTFISTKGIEFDIIEPYGFSFPNRLAKAMQGLMKNYKGTTDYTNAKTTPLKQYFILAISFFGYDSSGELVTSNSYTNADTGNEAGKQSIFDKYIDLEITNMSYRLEGKATTYKIKATSPTADAAYGTVWGRLQSNYTITATTVEEALNGLMKKLSDEESQRNKLSPEKMEKTTYSIRFESDKIKKAKVIDKQQFTGRNTSGDSGVKKSSESTESESEKTTPDDNTRKITFSQGTNLLQAIQNTITRSEYISKSLEVLNLDDLTAEEKAKQFKQKPTQELKWFSINPVVTINGRDAVRNAWTYNITYVIKEYGIPYVVPPFNEFVREKLGIFKTYDYTYTGKNTEILSFEHNINYSLINAVMFVPGLTEDSNRQDVPRHFIKANVDTSIAVDKTSQATGIIQTSLYNPAQFSRVNMTIMGDPDLIASSAEFTLSPEFKSVIDTYAINPTNSQLFCSLKFNTVGDYNLTTGLMSPSPIEFFTEKMDTKTNKRGDDILWLKMETVSHTFSGGKFTQELTCNQIKLSEAKKTDSANRSDAEDKNRNADTATPPIAASTQNVVTAAPAKKISNKDDDASSSANYGNEGRNYSKAPPIVIRPIYSGPFFR